MNKQRRDRLGKVFDQITEGMDVVDAVRREEEESYDNLPDSFRDGERGEEMQNYMEMLEEVSNYLDDARSVLEQI
ncbi:MAG: hypothetical protein LUC98_07615 [Lachnospiraceae bacterium]|nr:hypothetical protein [Lachnospiraceae bacterium]